MQLKLNFLHYHIKFVKDVLINQSDPVVSLNDSDPVVSLNDSDPVVSLNESKIACNFVHKHIQNPVKYLRWSGF